MTFAIGGSAKVRRIVKEPRKPWFCDCEGPDGMEIRPASLTRCLDCGARRP